MTVHDLKCWPEPFRAVWCLDKPYEIRKDDRGFSVGDYLLLREWVPELLVSADCGRYTSRCVVARVTYKTTGGEWGIPEGLCVLGMEIRVRGEQWDTAARTVRGVTAPVFFRPGEPLRWVTPKGGGHIYVEVTCG